MKTALEIVNGVPVLTVDGRRVAPMLAERENSFQDEENGRLMQSHGFHLSTAYTTMPWPREREAYDFGPVDVQMETIVRDDPSALYLPRIGCEPPQWWKEEHPEEMPVWENGKIDQLVSVASERWLREVCVHIDSLVRHLESRWDEHIIGYHPCAQNSMEWYYTSTINYCNDWGLKNYDEPFARGFRRWLGRQYGDIAALNDAWGAGYDTFEQIPAPAPDVRRATTHVPQGDIGRSERSSSLNPDYVGVLARLLRRRLHAQPLFGEGPLQLARCAQHLHRAYLLRVQHVR